MALGRRKRDQQQDLFITPDSLPKSNGHVFYKKLNELLDAQGFDTWIENLCQEFYTQGRGRPSIPPGIYFRMLLVGYFEGIQSQRGIAWRCADSLSLRTFLGIPLTESTPDHSSLTVIRERLPQSVHEAVFEWVLRIANDKKLLQANSVAVDSTTLEANAAMKSIVRKESGEDWRAYVIGLMQADGVISPGEVPSIDAMKRYDSSRKHKKVSNEEWFSPVDPQAKIARMKDGTTHLAYRAEHVVDTNSSLIIGAEIQSATASDNATLEDSLHAAQIHLDNAGATKRIKEVTADKGYHSTQSLTQLNEHTDFVTYIPEPKLAEGKKHNWKDKSRKERKAVLNNRKRTQSKKGKKLQRLRSEKVERSFAHTLETGGGRRTQLRGLIKNQKRHFLLTAAYNLGVIMRTLFKMGTARGLGAFFAYFNSLTWAVYVPDLLQNQLLTKISFRDRFPERIYHALARN
jgi:transposase